MTDQAEEVVEPTVEQVVEGSLVEPETPAITEEPAPSADEPTDGFQKRINKVTAQKYEQQRRADALQAENDRLKAAQPKEKTPQGAPKLEDFEFDEDAFRAASVKYEVNQEVSKLREEGRATQVAKQQEQTQTVFNEKIAAFDKEDYAETVSGIPQLPPATLSALMGAENGPELAYHLGKHLDVADKIAQMDPVRAVMELGSIAARLNAPKPTPQPSNAPEPVETVDGSAGLSKSVDEMSMEEIYSL